MSGIQFLFDGRGKKTAVMIDLKKHGALWEDVYDALIAQARSREPRESVESVRKRLRQREKLNGRN